MNKFLMAERVIKDVLVWDILKKEAWLNKNKGICLIFMKEWAQEDIEKYFMEKYSEMVHGLPEEILFAAYIYALNQQGEKAREEAF